MKQEETNIEYLEEEVENIEFEGYFDDEYVYDAKVGDSTETFFANDILVHNSTYVHIQPALDSVEGLEFESQQQEMDFCLKITERLEEYYGKCFEKYAKHYNTYNQQKFELEKFANRASWLKKKNYLLNITFEDGDWVKPKKSGTGVETVKSSFPSYVRQLIDSVYDFILDYGDIIEDKPKGESEYTLDDLIDELKRIKEKFKMKSIEDIAFNFKLQKYESYVESEYPLQLIKGIPFYARCSANYNYLVELSDGLDKYTKIRGGNNIRLYHCAENEYEFKAIGYPPDELPLEIMPPIDYNLQFFYCVIEPINRMLNILGFHELDSQFNRKIKIDKGKKTGYYPLYIFNIETFDYIQLPEQLNEYLSYPDSQIPESIYRDYLYYINYYGNNTHIVPNSGVDKLIERERKKLEKKEAKQEADE